MVNGRRRKLSPRRESSVLRYLLHPVNQLGSMCLGDNRRNQLVAHVRCSLVAMLAQMSLLAQSSRHFFGCSLDDHPLSGSRDFRLELWNSQVPGGRLRRLGDGVSA